MTSNIDWNELRTYQDFAKVNDRFESLTVNTKMITVMHKVTEFEDITNDEKRYEKYIKEKMALEIANLILKDDLVLFTKQNDVATYTKTYRARVFLANKDIVSILVKSGIK
jgi:Zn/Cd-binding protein ZinT